MRLDRMLFKIVDVLYRLLVSLYGQIPDGVRTSCIEELNTVRHEMYVIGADKDEKA